jgi:hypothetical protein
MSSWVPAAGNSDSSLSKAGTHFASFGFGHQICSFITAWPAGIARVTLSLSAGIGRATNPPFRRTDWMSADP